jgi:hypothetical protein
MKYSYNDLVSKLQDAVLNITFEKVDGTERTLQCTLRPEYLPEQYRNKAPMLTSKQYSNRGKGQASADAPRSRTRRS